MHVVDFTPWLSKQNGVLTLGTLSTSTMALWSAKCAMHNAQVVTFIQPKGSSNGSTTKHDVNRTMVILVM